MDNSPLSQSLATTILRKKSMPLSCGCLVQGFTALAAMHPSAHPGLRLIAVYTTYSRIYTIAAWISLTSNLSFSSFGTIFLQTSMVKAITKLPTTRSQTFIHSLVDTDQTCFLLDRSIFFGNFTYVVDMLMMMICSEYPTIVSKSTS